MGKIVLPCSGAILTHGFDEIRELPNKEKRIHGGYDIITKDHNKYVLSICEATIITAGWSDSFGYRIWVSPTDPELKNKYPYIVYGHLEKIKRFGGFVFPGDIIGIMGNTGMSKGVHLHLEARTTPNTSGKPIRIIEIEELLQQSKT